MEIHAHVPQMGKSASHWLLEGLFIVLSVGLAFGVGQYRESRDNHELAKRALAGLREEVEFNVRQVEPYLAYHRRWGTALEQAVDGTVGKTGLEVYAMTRPPLPADSGAEFPLEVRRGAWDAALSTGALRFVDYDVVAALSHLYQVQQFYGDAIVRISSAVTATPAFEPANRALVARQLAVDMQSLIFAERTLLEAYQKNLPAIRAAAEASR